MPAASKSRVSNTKIRASSPQFLISKKIRESNVDVDRNSQIYRYQITNTNITEIKITKLKEAENSDNQTQAFPTRNINPLHNTNSAYKNNHTSKLDPKNGSISNGPRRYSYNTALTKDFNKATAIEDALHHLAIGMHVNKDKPIGFVEASNSTLAPLSPVVDPVVSINGDNGAIISRNGVGFKTQAAALNIWGSKVPAYFVSNFDKVRFHLQTDALNMAILQLKMPKKDIWKCLVAELLGTCLLVVIGCGSGLTMTEPKALDLTGIGLAWGLTVGSLAQTLGHVSGCHLNPAVTLAMVVTGKIQLIKAGLYIVIQCLGATAGAVLLKALTPDDIKGNYGITTLAPSVTPLQGFGIEFITTFVLLLVIFGATDENRTDVKGSAPLAIGLAISALIYFAGPFTGASFNPARTLGPSIVAGHWNNHWIYWIGPIGGAVTAATFYHNVLRALSLDEIEALQIEEETKQQRSTETKESTLPTV